MIKEIFKKYKRRLMFVFVVLFLLVAVLVSYNIYRARRRYEEQAVMAQEYLDAGSYEEAIEAFKKAMTMKYGNKDVLSIGLAEAYAGINDYDKALEVLRSSYEERKTTELKEKIEEITARKADYNYYQLISYGDTYYANEEYDKAINEYEKAKLIKSKEETTYVKIVDAYIAMGKYDLAKEEIEEGMALIESDKLKLKLNYVDQKLKEQKYEEILNKASEYIYQENYEEALNNYAEAIRLMPQVDTAYTQMAELYISLDEYETARAILQNYLRSYESKTAKEILDKANELIEQKKEKQRILNELYIALNVADTEAITRIMKNGFFTDVIAPLAPYYYSPSGDVKLTMAYGMMIYDKNTIYAGGFKDEMKKGIGIYFVLNPEKGIDWYYYQGEWSNNMPNGMGRTVEAKHVKDEEGNRQELITKTSGMFNYGLEDGLMQKVFYTNNEETGCVNYTAQAGVPEPYLDENGQEIMADKPGYYVIGEIYNGNEPSGEYYSVRNGTTFSVKIQKEKQNGR